MFCNLSRLMRVCIIDALKTAKAPNAESTVITKKTLVQPYQVATSPIKGPSIQGPILPKPA